MPNSWATSGVDLHLDLKGPRRRAGLEAALRDAVRTGRLPPGLRLPSSRSLAGDLGVARNTVADAYSQLVAEGWLVARPGSATSVADRPAGFEATVPSVPPPGGARFDLRPGSPDLSAFPRSGWLAAIRRALTAAPDEAFGYGHPQGRPELRAALAGYLARARGVQTNPQRIVVCSGFTQGLGLVCQVLRAHGATTIAMEAFGLPDHRHIATAVGLDLRVLPVDGGGAVVEELGGADAVVVTPAHQFPLGMALAPARRAQTVQWAAATSGLVIEDDYDGEFRYDRQPIGAMQALAPERVVYAGTASKSLAPGLRLGWLALPADLVDEVAAAKCLADRNASGLDQLALAEFISSGAYDRHIRRSRLVYRRRRDRLVAALRDRSPQVRITGIAAGLHALVELPGGREDDIVAGAARHGLALEGLGAYRTGAGADADAGADDRPPAIVVGYGTPPEHAYSGALARFTAVLAEADRS